MSWGIVAVTVGSAVVGASAARSDRKSAEKQSKRAQAAIKTGVEEARADIARIFPQAQAQRLGGFQGAQQVFQGVVPQQVGAFQQGIGQAQQTVSATPQQQINALLGLGTDLSFLQPQPQFQPNFEFLDVPLAGQAPQQQIRPLRPPQGVNFGGFGPFGIGPSREQLFGQEQNPLDFTPGPFNRFGGGF